MAKRLVENDESSDAEAHHHDSTPAKRPRVEDASDEEDVPPPPRSKKTKGKAKQVANDEDQEDAELDARLSAANLSRITADVDDADFEAEHEAAVLDAMNRRSKKPGSIAVMGIIEAIEMHHFMCHPRLSFKFGPQINFIIGHNGSGKSAVLSALTIALGGKAISTGRGNGLKSFIREGQNTAEVSITLKNQGEESFKPDIYGKSIIVTRRFSKEGSSSYKIKNADGKTISTKRDELSAICDHMNIQVDNPMNVLTQDSARQFLSASRPQDKYQFFLKGTQLTQLNEEYETCLENIGKTTRTLQLKREEIPDLEKAFREADARNKEATKAREKQTQLAEYKRELAWAHVKAKEDEMTKQLGDVAKARRRLPRIEQSIQEAEAALLATVEKVEEFEAEKAAVPSIGSIKTELAEAKALFDKNRDDIREHKANEREMNQQMNQLSNEITGFENEIRLRAESQGAAQTERERIQHLLQKAMMDLDNAKEELEMVSSEPVNLEKRVRELDVRGRQMVNDVNAARKDVEAAISNIEQCQRKDGDELRIYGQDLSTVLKHVKDETWMGEVPIGPFGLFVSVKDPKWTHVMRMQIGQLMTSWAVTDNRDRHKLKKILDHSGNNNIQIIITEVDLFDYSRGEPPSDILTALRVLDIKHEFVKRILINQRNIEKIVLADSRSDGDQLLMRLGGNGVAWSLDGYIPRRYADGGGQSVPMQRVANNDPRNHMFTGGDRTADLRRFQDVKHEAETRLQLLMTNQSDLRREYTDLQRRLTEAKACFKRQQSVRGEVSRLEQEIIRLQADASLDAPVNIDFLEESKVTAIEGRNSISTQYESIIKRRMELDAENKLLHEKRAALIQQVTDWEAGMEAIRRKLAAALQDRVKATKDKAHWQAKLVAESAQVDELEAIAEILQKEFEEWSEKAEQIGPQVEKPRKADFIYRQIESVQKALAQHERQQGASPEEISMERDNAKIALDTHKRQLKEVSNLNKALKTSLAIRMSKWITFRQHIALRCKYQFQHHLFTRGYYGKVIFDHNECTLNLKVQTEDQAGTQSKDKDPKSLSGGEKSYSTICLLLALWESIQCPIRCLDEFDVFMDAANRRISMKMMIEAANTSDKQYILITPQDMSYVAFSSSVRVHRMLDPERNQNSLNFGENN
ncbi:P-loop containing nucleoside triphosphate hydrolase protein [Hysterangium stoloniferum]|nr:P-loop containing nucleoside triphosphate hydrolase protein [Hysterangium stoloniferum]